MDRERNFNLLRGCVLGSFLENKEKRDLCNFINELESSEDCTDGEELMED